MTPSRSQWLFKVARVLRGKASLKGRPAACVRLERLEDRTAPAVFNVAAGDLAGLRAAINTAVNNGQTDTINIGAGTTAIDAGRGDNANATGDLDVNIVDGFRIDFVGQGATAADTVLDGGDFDRVIHVGSGAVGFQNMTITNGTATDNDVAGVTGSVIALGGGILAETGVTLSLDDVIVSLNEAAGDAGTLGVAGQDASGGGIHQKSGGSLPLLDVSVINNSAVGGAGFNGADGADGVDGAAGPTAPARSPTALASTSSVGT